MEVRRIRPHLWTSWIVWMAFFGARGISKKWPVNAWRASAGAHPGIILLMSGQAKHWMQKGIFHLRRSKALHQIDFLVLDDIPLIVLATSEKQTAWGSTGHTRGCAAAGGSGVMLRHLPTHCLWAISEAPIPKMLPDPLTQAPEATHNRYFYNGACWPPVSTTTLHRLNQHATGHCSDCFSFLRRLGNQQRWWDHSRGPVDMAVHVPSCSVM